MIRPLLFGAVGVVALATTVSFAADLPSRRSPPVYVPPPVPTFSWTGFYVGANVGYATNLRSSHDSCIDNTGTPFGGTCQVVPPFSLDANGVIGGGQIGYNYQIGALVIGGEADFDGSSLHKTADVPGPFAFANPAFGIAATSSYSASERLDYLGTARLRVGYLVVDRLLAYATGGFAYGQAELNTLLISPGSATSYPSGRRSTFVGYAAGGGLEYALTNHLSIKGEALYTSLGTRMTQSSEVPSTFAPQNYQHNGVFPLDFLVGRVGINYKFGDTPLPVVARY